MDNQVSIRFIKTEEKSKYVDVSEWFKFFQAHNKYLNKSDKQIEHFLRNYTFCIQYGKKIATHNLEGLYSILIGKIKLSSYNDSRLEIIFKLTDEEKNYWLTGFPFKFHEDIIEQTNKEQSIYRPTFYEENFKSRHTQFEIGNKTGIKNLPDFIDSTKKSVFGLIKKWLIKHKSVKAHLCVICTYEKGGIIDVVESAVKYLQTPNYDIFQGSNLDEIYKEMKAKILYEHERVSDSLRGSQWVLVSINTLNVAINKYAPIKGSSYIPTPEKLLKRKAVINVKNEYDDKCFLWSILAHLYPADENPQRVTKYQKYERLFDYDQYIDIEYPMEVSKIPSFLNSVNEKDLIKGGLSINVYHHVENYNINPLYVTKDEKKVHIDLLLLKDGDNTHYCLIKNLWRLVKGQVTKNH